MSHFPVFFPSLLLFPSPPTADNVVLLLFPLLSQQKQLYAPPGNNVVSQPVVTKVSEGGNES